MNREFKIGLIVVALITGFSSMLLSQIPAFPTDEGYGMWAKGVRGGQMVEVTNLLDCDDRIIDIRLVNMKGQKIANLPVLQLPVVEVPVFPNGLYVLKMKSENGTQYTSKIIK